MKFPKLIQLSIAELVVSAEPAVISTVLGSCVSVCLFSPETRVGGMIHFALPRLESGNLSHGGDERLRYGNSAVPALVREVSRRSRMPSSTLKAKIVGGAFCLGESHSPTGIGAQNAKVAENMLMELGIEVIGRQLGGELGRKAFFYTDTGRLRISFLAGPRSDTAREAEPPVCAPVPAQGKKKVLIIDDSKTIQKVLRSILSQDPLLEIVGAAANPIMARPMIRDLKPDVLTLDIHMPEMDGVTFLEELLPKTPMPVVMITSVSLEESDHIFRALELGAVDYIQKPSFREMEVQGPLIREKVLSAAYTKVKRPIKAAAPLALRRPSGNLDQSTVIAIGSSTGGTEALKALLTRLPKEIPPIVIVQHIPPVFSAAFAKRLNELCPFAVKEAGDGDELKPGLVLVAPGGKQMKIEKFRLGFRIRLTDDPPVNRHKPSVDYLFDSVAPLVGRHAIGVVLTGMGNDGAKGLLKLKGAGARTVVQNEETCVVYGMPKAAFELGAAMEVQPLDKIPEVILKWTAKKRSA